MTVPEESHSVKVSIGNMIAEIPEVISEQMMTSLIRAMRNASFYVRKSGNKPFSGFVEAEY